MAKLDAIYICIWGEYIKNITKFWNIKRMATSDGGTNDNKQTCLELLRNTIKKHFSIWNSYSVLLQYYVFEKERVLVSVGLQAVREQ